MRKNDSESYISMARGRNRISTFLQSIAHRGSKEEQLKRLNRTLNALRHSSEAITRAKTEKEFLDDVCRIIIEDCGHAMVWIGYKEQDEHKSVRPVACSGFEKGYLDTLKITWADTERGRGPTGTAVRTGKPAFCRSMLTDPKFAPWREEALKRGYASSLVLPLLDAKKSFGSLTIYFREPDPFTGDEIQLLSELADDLAYGIMAIRLREAHERAERALLASEAKANALIKYAPTGIYEVDYQSGKFLSVNDALCHMLGYTREELFALGPSGLLNEDSGVRFAERMKKQLAGEKIDESVEYTARKKDGTIMYGILNVSINLSGGEPQKALVVAHDITERKRIEEEILRLASFPRLNPNPTTEIELNGVIHFVNPAAEQLFPDLRKLGLSHPWLKHWQSIIDELDSNTSQQMTREVSVAGRHYYQTIHYVKESNCLRIYGTDITDRKKAEESLRDTNEELTRFNEAAVGRELAMIELKKEINELCLQTDQPPRYPLEFEKEPQ